MKLKNTTCYLLSYFLFPFFLFSPWDGSIKAQGLNQKLEWVGLGAFDHADVSSSSSDLQNDTADVTVEHATAYPGSKDFLVTVSLKNPVPIVGFDFVISITQADLADFSTVRIYVDSLDTCTAPEDTCWKFFAIRECLVVPGEVIEGWAFLQVRGETGDTTQPDCDQLWTLGMDLYNPIPPQTDYVTLFEFGVDLSCVPDSLTDRTVTFVMTGNLSDELGRLVSLRYHPGELTIWSSVPGDANNDSLVGLTDVLFLINYLYKGGPAPCVKEAADPKADCVVDLGDVVYMINFLFRGGPAPVPGCAH